MLSYFQFLHVIIGQKCKELFRFTMVLINMKLSTLNCQTHIDLQHRASCTQSTNVNMGYFEPEKSPNLSFNF